MATLTFFHAHPDDEAVATAGTMALASQAGHRVVLVVATGGELGEPVPGVLAPGESLADRRRAETDVSAGLLGIHDVVFLGYRDSGMMGEPTNDDPRCFWQADPAEASGRLAEVLGAVGTDVLVAYDANGGYGHPDHIQVHRIGHQAANLAGIPTVFEATLNRTHITELLAASAEATAAVAGEDHDQVATEAVAADVATQPELGCEAAEITHAIDVTAVADLKRAAMAAHASQIAPDSFFLTMDDATFNHAFGTEWFIRAGHRRPEGDPFATSLLGLP